MLEEKWKNDELKPHRITVNDLTCNNCKYKKDNIWICTAYPKGKPSKIISDGAKCVVKWQK